MCTGWCSQAGLRVACHGASEAWDEKAGCTADLKRAPWHTRAWHRVLPAGPNGPSERSQRAQTGSSVSADGCHGHTRRGDCKGAVFACLTVDHHAFAQPGRLLCPAVTWQTQPVERLLAHNKELTPRKSSSTPPLTTTPRLTQAACSSDKLHLFNWGLRIGTRIFDGAH